MKCPHCQVKIDSPSAQHACVDGVEVLIMVCPECKTILDHQSFAFRVFRPDTNDAGPHPVAGL